MNIVQKTKTTKVIDQHLHSAKHNRARYARFCNDNPNQTVLNVIF